MNPECQNCEEREATVWCGNCGDGFRLCNQCDEAEHSRKLTAGHKRIPLKEYQKTALPKCATHTNNDLEHYCVDCKMLFCSSCILAHKSHETVSVHDRAEKFREKLFLSLKLVEDSKPALQDDSYLMDKFEKSAAETARWKREVDAVKEAAALLDSGLIKVREAIEACTTHELVGSAEQLRERVRVIASLLPSEAGTLLVDQFENESTSSEPEKKVNMLLPQCLLRFHPRKVQSHVVTSIETMSLGYFDSLTIKEGGVLCPPPWDGEKGGVLLLVAREITIEIGGLISATGCGYRGGRYGHQGESWTGLGEKNRSPNGGGGGSSSAMTYKDQDFYFGGAGASFATKAKHGDRTGFNDSEFDAYVGQPGETYNPFSQMPRTLLGSGGGCAFGFDAFGGNGGGAIIIRAHTIRLDGAIRSRGSLAPHATGGGGSGGLVLIVAENVLGSGVVRTDSAIPLGEEGSRKIRSTVNLAGGLGGNGHTLIRSPNFNAKLDITTSPEPKIENNLVFPDLSTLSL